MRAREVEFRSQRFLHSTCDIKGHNANFLGASRNQGRKTNNKIIERKQAVADGNSLFPYIYNGRKSAFAPLGSNDH